MSEVKVNKISPRSGTDVTLGDASDTFTIPASATLDVNGTIDVTGATVTGLSAGKILQVVQGTVAAGSVTTTSTTYVTSGLEATLTPASTSNKVLIMTSFTCGQGGIASTYISRMLGLAIFRGSGVGGTKIVELQNLGRNLISGSGADANGYDSMAFNYLDSPSTTSAQTYTVGCTAPSSDLTVTMHNGGASYMTLMEVEA
jgi:hypothetical protein